MAKVMKTLSRLLAGAAVFRLALMGATGSRRKKRAPAKEPLETLAAPDAATPNILFFILDDLDARTMQVMLDANMLPNIRSKIVEGGVDFQNTYVPCSICSPSRASLLTGKFTHNHGVWHVAGSEGPTRFDAYLAATDDGYLPNWIGPTYYRAFVGKYHLGFRHPQWDRYQAVDGYDPRPGMYKSVEDGREVMPNVYQTKYIGDAAKQAIAASGSKPFFLMVSPTALHVNVSGWHKKDNYATGGFTGIPVAYDQFPNGAGWRQHLVTTDFSSGAPVYRWWSRDSDSRDRGWGDWTSIGDASTVAPGTGSSAVVGWNVLLPSPNVRRQQLVRQLGANVEFYARDIITGQPTTAWARVADQATLAGTGTAPVAAWTAAYFPSGLIRQQVIRGSESEGYAGYVRHRLPTTGAFTSWRVDPDWGESVVFGRLCGFAIIPTGGPRYVVQLVMRRPGAATYDWWESGQLVDFQEMALRGTPTSGLESASAPPPAIDVADEGDLYRSADLTFSPRGIIQREQADRQAGPESVPERGPTVVTEVHPYFMLRGYAEGSWWPVTPGQTYDYGGDLPAGRLRPNHDPNDFRPSSAQFDLPRGKSSWNRQLDSALPFYSPQTWPDLTAPVPGNRQQQDYLQRLYLDRLEQMLSVDRMVGEVIDAAGPNTLIIFTGDNGHFHGEHRLSNKLSPQEESVQVPLYIRSPKGITRQIADLTANIDLAPTILEYAGRPWANPAFKIDGRSLRHFVEGATGPNWRKSLLLEYHRPRGVSEPDRSGTDWRFGLPDYLGLRQRGLGGGVPLNTVYVQYYADVNDLTTIVDYEYYHLDVDPFQTDNLANGRIIELDQILRDFYGASGAQCRDQDMRFVPPAA